MTRFCVKLLCRLAQVLAVALFLGSGLLVVAAEAAPANPACANAQTEEEARASVTLRFPGATITVIEGDEALALLERLIARGLPALPIPPAAVEAVMVVMPSGGIGRAAIALLHDGRQTCWSIAIPAAVVKAVEEVGS